MPLPKEDRPILDRASFNELLYDAEEAAEYLSEAQRKACADNTLQYMRSLLEASDVPFAARNLARVLRFADRLCETTQCATSYVDAQARQLINSVEPFRFLDLPPELRNRIYSMSMATDDTIWIPCSNSQDMQPDITRVNSQIRREALPVFYAENTFQMDISRCDWGLVLDYCDSVRDWGVKWIANAHVRFYEIRHEVNPNTIVELRCAESLRDLFAWHATRTIAVDFYWQSCNLGRITKAVVDLGRQYYREGIEAAKAEQMFNDWLRNQDLQCECGMALFAWKGGDFVACSKEMFSWPHGRSYHWVLDCSKGGEEIE